MDTPVKNSLPYEFLTYLRRLPEYALDITRIPGDVHPFHKRFNAKPKIYCAGMQNMAALRKFTQGKREAEYLELQDEGLTSKVIVYIGPKQLEFKSVVEAECMIADYLSGA